MSCERPIVTKRVVNTGAGALAYCRTCKRMLPAEQVPWGRERRDSLGRITATYAAKPHERIAK